MKFQMLNKRTKSDLNLPIFMIFTKLFASSFMNSANVLILFLFNNLITYALSCECISGHSCSILFEITILSQPQLRLNLIFINSLGANASCAKLANVIEKWREFSIERMSFLFMRHVAPFRILNAANFTCNFNNKEIQIQFNLENRKTKKSKTFSNNKNQKSVK